jgi:hypothetical protein
MTKGARGKPPSRRYRKRLKRNQVKTEQRVHPNPRGGNLSHFVRWPYAVIVAAATLASFVPVFSVSQKALSNLSDPFSAPFVITYENVFPIKDLQTECRIKHLDTIDKPPVQLFDVWAEHPAFYKSMWYGDAITTDCQIERHLSFDQVATADVEIIVNYWPLLIPEFIGHAWHRRFHFMCQRVDGAYRWYQEPE